MDLFSQIIEDGDMVTIYDINGTWNHEVDKYEMPESLAKEFEDTGGEVEDFIEKLIDEERNSDLNKIYITKLD